MTRTYAAVMALIGMVVVLLRGLKDNAGFEETIISSLLWMALLGTLGIFIGAIAENTIVESVRIKIESELATVNNQESES